MKLSQYACTQCGSRSTQSCAVAYEQSTREGPNYTSESGFAARVAPPRLASIWPPIIAMVVAVTSMKNSDLLGSLVTIPIAVALAVRWFRRRTQCFEERKIYPMLWVCRDCGKIFMPSRNSAQS